MLFNSVQFLIFLPIVVVLWFQLPQKWRNIFLLLASYYFYMCWKAEYLILILLSTGVDYFAALKMQKTHHRKTRKALLYLSLLINLGLLFSFKYFNFFSDSLEIFLKQFNVFYETPHFHILLPVGISFYTFQTLSYTIDVYRSKTRAEKNFIDFALYVSFFPQLVAGPIERSYRLLPQIKKKHTFSRDRLFSGLRLMLWGYFQKVLIADRLAYYVNEVYNHSDQYYGWTIWIATFFFAFQIFCDFSGYTDIARGAARILGYDIMLNFRRPYFALTIRDFWQRWHISLSTWFRDYVYIPLGGNRVVQWRWYYNLLLTFVISGLWHGANWTFLFWGALHGLYLILGYAVKIKNPILNTEKMHFLIRPVQILFTFFLVNIAWVFFRAQSISQGFQLLSQAIDFKSFTHIDILTMPYELPLSFILISVLILVHIIQAKIGAGRFFSILPVTLRWAVYLFFFFAILLFGVFTNEEFIYFQF